MPEQQSIVLTPVPLADLIQQIGNVFDEKIKVKSQGEKEALISSEEACNVFRPRITRPTLQAWTDQGLLKSYRLAGRVWYKHSEIISAATEIKRYKKAEEQSPACTNHPALPVMMKQS